MFIQISRETTLLLINNLNKNVRDNWRVAIYRAKESSSDLSSESSSESSSEFELGIELGIGLHIEYKFAIYIASKKTLKDAAFCSEFVRALNKLNIATRSTSI
jgi:hypothetical protein